MTTLFHNGRFFTGARGDDADQPVFANAMVIEDGLISYVGSDESLEVQAEQHASVVDVQGRLVLPGFVDGHMHMLMHGQSLTKVNLEACRSLEEIRADIKQHCQAHPDDEQILCRGWQQYTTGGMALASMLDGIDPRPIFVDALDLHSAWCSTAALKELAVDDVADPEGGTIHRDDSGEPSGLFSETAAQSIIWPFVAQITPLEAKVNHLKESLKAYSAQGITGTVEMAMDETAWEAIQLLRSREEMPTRMAMYWIITPKDDPQENLAQVDRAIQLKEQFNAETSPDCHFVGIKMIGDGVVDGCTAALSEPYSVGHPGALIWTRDMLEPVLRRAVSANLQCAIHAIGDAAVKTAVDSLEAVGSVGRRHRIEHLELASAEDAQRLGKLGITASVQAVHSDPAILRAWPRLLGQHRCDRAFPYKEMADHGATLALGSDAPTATHVPFNNVYSATTTGSATEPDHKETISKSAVLSLVAAIQAATYGAAYSVFAENRIGLLKEGFKADFAVLDMDWDPETLLKARVHQTWFGGRKVYENLPA